MTLWTCNTCGALIDAGGITAAAIEKAMKKHVKECTAVTR